MEQSAVSPHLTLMAIYYGSMVNLLIITTLELYQQICLCRYMILTVMALMRLLQPRILKCWFLMAKQVKWRNVPKHLSLHQKRTELLSVFLIKSTHLTELILMVCVYVISVVLTSHAIFSLRTVIAGCMHLTMTLRLCGISRVIRIPDIFLLQLILTEMDMMNF